MKTASLAFIIVATLIPGLGLAQTKSATNKARAGVDESLKAFAAAVEKGDGKAIAALYTADAQLLPSGQDIVSGSKEIEAFFTGMMNVVKKIDFETLEVIGQGDTVAEVGKYTLYDGAGKTVDNGKYIVVWKRDGKSWKLHRDIFNTSVKAPPAAAPRTK